jgi:hypothetical protein
MRTCGDCIACCTYFKIEALEKNIMVHCPHAKLPGPVKPNMAYLSGASVEGNCRIYFETTKPDICNDYVCLWLRGYGGEEDRPDRSRMLFDTVRRVENAIEAKALEPGREDTEAGRALTEKMSKETGKPAVVIGFYTRGIRRIVGQPVGGT